MSEVEKTGRAKIQSFRLDLHLGATVSINGEAWVKPGASSGITWSGLPTDEEVKMATEFITKEILEPTMAEVMKTVTENTKKAKGI